MVPSLVPSSFPPPSLTSLSLSLFSLQARPKVVQTAAPPPPPSNPAPVPSVAEVESLSEQLAEARADLQKLKLESSAQLQAALSQLAEKVCT
jgi:hypothetical protein